MRLGATIDDYMDTHDPEQRQRNIAQIARCLALLLFISLFGIVWLSCGGGGNGDKPTGPTQTSVFSLIHLSGDNQAGPQESVLSEPLVVLVTDDNGEPATGLQVTFAILSGKCSLSVESAVTDSSGHASTVVTLGDQAGDIRVQATLAGYDKSVVFTAVALPPNTVGGHLVLPDVLDPTETTILCGFEESTPTEGGNFFAAPPEIHSLTIALDSEGDPFLLALLPPSDGSPSVDTQTTAVTLMFFAMYLYTAPPELWAEAVSVLEGIPEVQELSSVLGQRLEVSTDILVDPDPQVRSALESAIQAVDAEFARMVGAPKVTPSGPQSQVRLIHPVEGEDEATLEVRNFGRRYISLYADRTAPTAQNVMDGDIIGPASEPVSIATLVNFLSSNRDPSGILSLNTERFDIPLEPGATNLFDVDVVGASFRGIASRSDGYWTAWSFTFGDFVLLKLLDVLVGLDLPDGSEMGQWQEWANLTGKLVRGIKASAKFSEAVDEGSVVGILYSGLEIMEDRDVQEAILGVVNRVAAKQIGVVALGKMISKISPWVKVLKITATLTDYGFIAHSLITDNPQERFVVEAEGEEVQNQPPVASITSLADEGVSITFQGGAADPEDGSLSGSCLVWSSSRDGQIGTGETVSTSSLSLGTHTITLTATDSEGDSGSVSITLTIRGGNQPPVASITSPADGSTSMEGDAVDLQGSAADPEDESLSGSSLVWTSSRDGQIGTGETVSTLSLSLGTHTITLTATDSEGAVGKDQIALAVASVVVERLFGHRTDFTAGNTPRSVFIADLDRDGDNDLAVANFMSGNVSVLSNNGDGTFAPKVDYAAGDGPFSVFIVDLDGDGDNDLAVANSNSNTVSVLMNNGDGTFAPKVDYATGDGSRSIFIADLDRDGDNDLAVATLWSGTVSVLLNNGDGTFAPKVDYGTGDVPVSVFSADLDGDGDNDLAVANLASYDVSVLLNNGDGTFAPKVDYGTGDVPVSVFSADLDGDGDNDLAVANLGGNVSVLMNLSIQP